MVNDEEIDRIGVFGFENNASLIKEGNSLYESKEAGTLLAEFTIISGALRESNISSAKSMAEMVELQRSVGMTNNLMSDIADLERSTIAKIAK
jgi:flagellar basal body rod protein FlgG